MAGLPLRHLEPLEQEPRGDWLDQVKELRSKLGTGMLCGLVGGRGSGKTRAAVAVVRQAVLVRAREHSRKEPQYYDERYPFAVYRKTMTLFLDVRSSFKAESQTEKDVIKQYTEPGLLVLDEIQERGGSEWEDRLLTYVIDQRYDAKKDTLLISNLKPAEFAKNIGSSIVSRIQECGQLYEFVESFRTPRKEAP